MLGKKKKVHTPAVLGLSSHKKRDGGKQNENILNKQGVPSLACKKRAKQVFKHPGNKRRNKMESLAHFQKSLQSGPHPRNQERAGRALPNLLRKPRTQRLPGNKRNPHKNRNRKKKARQNL